MNTYPKEPIKIVGVPHFTEFGVKNYLTAYHNLQNKYSFNELIKVTIDYGCPNRERKEYHFYLYELQKEAFNEVLSLLARYNSKDLRLNIFDRFGTAPNLEYFQNLFDLIRTLEVLKNEKY
ncbi:MAG: hypothetical protein KBA33_08325 [Cloacibacterium sp.]|nr:hypothetical protein [Cloacibacterium sp.]